VDCETSYVRLGLAQELAVALQGQAVRLGELRADALTRLVKAEADNAAA
jgi:magnesium chelatase subunit D